ncbi:putative leader peptide [Streptomyces carminius]|uniref:putative leader peptide n=1 Tax=Streptomyces carminius TaxID=2665496 RepID=UPI0018EE0D00
MVNHDVSDIHPGTPPGTLLVARLHVDLCRLASALGRPPRSVGTCTRCATARG